MALLHLIVAFGLLLSVTCYLSLATYYLLSCLLLSDAFYLQLVNTCKNLFLSLVVVRLVIFFILGHLSPITIIMSQGMPAEGKAPLRAKLKKQNLPKRPKNLPKNKKIIAEMMS